MDKACIQLRSLERRRTRGMISESTFQLQRSRILDKLAGKDLDDSPSISNEDTAMSCSLSKSMGDSLNDNKPVQFPDSLPYPVETALKFTLDDPDLGLWGQHYVKVVVEPTAFARGTIRSAYFLLEFDPKLEGLIDPMNCVAKASVDPFAERNTYFTDVYTQTYSQKFSKAYNNCNPPKKVEIIPSWVLQLVDRPGAPILGVEPFIPGTYRKHNNNRGFVSEDERNTPQAFSHFTYEISGHDILVCDIQGVNDRYTDPQIHCTDETAFGGGNLGTIGFRKFVETHKCNSICRFLKLPSFNGSYYEDEGTLPTSEPSFVCNRSISYRQLPSNGSLFLPRDSDLDSNLTSRNSLFFCLCPCIFEM